MAINDIVLWLYKDQRVNQFIAKQHPQDIQQDLLHHCILEIYRLYEKWPGKIEKLHTEGKLWPYFHGMASMQLRSKTSTFFRKYRRGFEPEEKIPLMVQQPDEVEIKQVDQDFVDYVYSQIEKPKKERTINFKQMVLL